MALCGCVGSVWAEASLRRRAQSQTRAWLLPRDGSTPAPCARGERERALVLSCVLAPARKCAFVRESRTDLAVELGRSIAHVWASAVSEGGGGGWICGLVGEKRERGREGVREWELREREGEGETHLAVGHAQLCLPVAHAALQARPAGGRTNDAVRQTRLRAPDERGTRVTWPRSEEYIRVGGRKNGLTCGEEDGFPRVSEPLHPSRYIRAVIYEPLHPSRYNRAVTSEPLHPSRQGASLHLCGPAACATRLCERPRD
jgi:hypothetical protein